jgi:hypothetical protein
VKLYNVVFTYETCMDGIIGSFHVIVALDETKDLEEQVIERYGGDYAIQDVYVKEFTVPGYDIILVPKEGDTDDSR